MPLKKLLLGSFIAAKPGGTLTKGVLYTLLSGFALLVAVMWGAIAGIAIDEYQKKQDKKYLTDQSMQIVHDTWEATFVSKEYEEVENLTIFTYYLYSKKDLPIENFTVSVPMGAELGELRSQQGTPGLGVDFKSMVYGVRFSEHIANGQGKMYRFALKGKFDVEPVVVSLHSGIHLMRLKRPGPVPWALQAHYEKLQTEMQQERDDASGDMRTLRLKPYGQK